MKLARRYLLISVPLMAITVPAMGQAWLALGAVRMSEIGEALSAAADGLKKAVDAIAFTARQATAGFDFANARFVTHSLKHLVGILDDSYVNNGPAITFINEYGDTWRRYTNYGTQPPQSQQLHDLQMRWLEVKSKIHYALETVLTAVDTLHDNQSNAVLSDAYLELADALMGKREVLNRLQFTPAPISPDEVSALVDQEEQFLHFRLALKEGIERLMVFVRQSAN